MSEDGGRWFYTWHRFRHAGFAEACFLFLVGWLLAPAVLWSSCTHGGVEKGVTCPLCGELVR